MARKLERTNTIWSILSPVELECNWTCTHSLGHSPVCFCYTEQHIHIAGACDTQRPCSHLTHLSECGPPPCLLPPARHFQSLSASQLQQLLELPQWSFSTCRGGSWELAHHRENVLISAHDEDGLPFNSVPSVALRRMRRFWETVAWVCLWEWFCTPAPGDQES